MTVAGGRGHVRISLPTNVELADAHESTEGTVVYSPRDDLSGGVVVEAISDGSVQIQTVIGDAADAHSLVYELDLSDGASLEVADTGAVVAWTAKGTFEGGLAIPWAVDANREAVDTFFTVDGTTVTQHVLPGAETAYPIVADPWLGIALIDDVTRTWYSGQGYRYSVYPSWWGRGGAGFLARQAAWTEAKETGSGIPQTMTLMNQFYCHYDYRPVTTFKGSWNLESWKADKGYAGWIASVCN